MTERHNSIELLQSFSYAFVSIFLRILANYTFKGDEAHDE